jgi:3-oxoacyl-[acyl-carrier protein] reductase
LGTFYDGIARFNHICYQPYKEADMELNLKGKVAVVAGASRGLGFSMAKAIGIEGARLAICSRDSANINKACDELKLLGIDAKAYLADVSKPSDTKAFIEKAALELGGIDILVTNAGGPPSMPFEAIDDNAWEEGFRLNLLSAIIMIRAAIPFMKEKNCGRIINLTSIAVKQPIDGLIISNTIRAGVIGLAKTLSRELAPFNITINNILPGYFRTLRIEQLADKLAENKKSRPEEIIEYWKNDIPLKRLGEPEEIGHLAAFLASDKAAYITGTSIPIDGGFYKGLM